MKYWLYIVLMIIVIIIFMELIKLAFLVEIFVVLPLFLVIISYFVFLYNFKFSQIAKSIPEKGNSNRIQQLNDDSVLMEQLGFERFDTFYLSTIPDCIIYSFIHFNEPIYGYIYHYGPKKEFDFTTIYKDISLTTSSTVGAGSIPKPPGNILQIFENVELGFMLDEHRRAIDFLRHAGLTPIDMLKSNFRKLFFKEVSEEFQYIKSFSFWPVQIFLWILSKRGKMYLHPLEEQLSPSYAINRQTTQYRNELLKIIEQSKPKDRYRVIFKGDIREGFDIKEIKDNLLRIFKVDPEKIDRLFKVQSITIKNNISKQVALKYKQAFYKAGAVCHIQDNFQIERASMSGDNTKSSIDNGRPVHPQTRHQEKMGCFAYALAFFSFIPLYGVPIGIVSIILGLIKRKAGGWKVSIIGGLGILFTVMSYSGAYYLGFKQRGGVVDKMKTEMAQRQLTELVRMIEFHKLQKGYYPESLEKLVANSEEHIFILDVTDITELNKKPRNYYYELDPTGEFYYLQSKGFDGVLSSNDDIYPLISDYEIGSLGYRRRIDKG